MPTSSEPDDNPDDSARPVPGRDSPPDGMSGDLRADLAAVLPATVFPADRAELLAYAIGRRVADSVRDALDGLPPDTVFTTITEVLDRAEVPNPVCVDGLGPPA